MIWAFLAGFFVALLIASWISSNELDAAYRQVAAMDSLCRRAYEHMNEAPPIHPSCRCVISPRFRTQDEIVVERLLADCGYTGEVE